MDAEEARAMGRRVRQIRNSRQKSLRVIAGLAGMSTNMLYRIERGERPLDRRSEIAALANALQVAPSDLTGTLAEQTEPSESRDRNPAVEETLRALMAAQLGYPEGRKFSSEVLRDRIARLQLARRRGRFAEVGQSLPMLIRDLHTSIDARHGLAELLPLATLLHVDIVAHWLHDAGEPARRLQAATLAREAAHEHGGVTTVALAAWGSTVALVTDRMVTLAQAELDATVLPPSTAETGGILCGLTMTQSLVAAMDNRPGDVEPPLDMAAELAERFGAADGQLGFAVGPAEVEVRRMKLALEADEPDRAAAIAETIRPAEISFVARRAGYWMEYGQALARLRGRQDDAVKALRAAERLFPERVHTNPYVRDALAGLMMHAKRDSTGRELREMVHNVGLPV